MTNSTSINAPWRAFELGIFETIRVNCRTLECLKYMNRDNDKLIESQDTFDELLNRLMDRVEQTNPNRFIIK